MLGVIIIKASWITAEIELETKIKLVVNSLSQCIEYKCVHCASLTDVRFIKFFSDFFSNCFCLWAHTKIFEPKINFSARTQHMKSKALSNLKLLKRSCFEFRCPEVLKAVYFSLVRSRLGYASQIWYNDSVSQNQQLESFRNNCLRYVALKCNFQRSPHLGNDVILCLIRINPLKFRR